MFRNATRDPRSLIINNMNLFPLAERYVGMKKQSLHKWKNGYQE